MKKAFLFCLLMILTVMLILSCSSDKKTNPDTESPTVTITYPPNNSSFASGTAISIVAEADDNEEVDNVKFYIDGVNLYEDTSEPYGYNWNTTDLSGSHTIYAKATDTSDNTATSDIVTVIITNEGEAPNPPTNPNPQSGATNISINTTLSWTCSDPNGDQLTYDVYFGTTTTPLLVSTDLTVCNFVPGTLQEETIYYWYVEATDTDENTTIGQLWSFTTLTDLSLPFPSNPNPADNATDVSVDTNLSWTCTDPNGDPLTFDVHFGTSSNPSIVSSGQSGTSFDPGTLNEGTTYYWKITAYDDQLNSTAGPTWEFETENDSMELEIIGNCSPLSLSYDLIINDNIAYLSDHHDGLQIIDISNLNTPNTIGSYDLPQFCYNIYVENNLAIIANKEYGYRIFDISTPSNPELLSTFPVYNEASGAFIIGEIAYLTDMTHLLIVDISNPSYPIQIGSINCAAITVIVENDYAYVTGGSYSLSIIDVSNPSNPISVGSYSTGGYSYNLFINNSYAFIADTDNGLSIIDISNPSSPFLISECEIDYAMDVFADNNYAYIADRNNGLKIVSISDIYEPEIVGELELTSSTNSIYVEDGIIYVANGFNGLQIVHMID